MTNTIMIVEDDADNMKLLADLIKFNGDYNVIKATNGSQVLDMLDGIAPDLIFMDIQLSGILTGIDLIRAIKALKSEVNIPVVILSAFQLTPEEVKKSGCDQYISKPFQMNDIVSVLNKYFERC